MIAEADVYKSLSDIFADVFLREDIALSPELSAKDVEGWDSFKQVEIVMAAEERFQMKFKSAELDSMRTLADLVRPIVERGTG